MEIKLARQKYWELSRGDLEFPSCERWKMISVVASLEISESSGLLW